MPFNRNTAYQALKDACDDLFARQFSYQSLSEKGNTINHKSRWVSEVAYIDNEAVVRLIFAPAIVPLITRLEEQFTKYEIQQISNLTSAYAVRLYEILIAWRSTGKTPLITMYDFRQKIGVLETEYKRMYDFKKYVLDIALKQVNEHTDIIVKVEQHKTGRSITGFSFSFKQKKSATHSVESKRDPNTLDLFSKASATFVGFSPPASPHGKAPRYPASSDQSNANPMPPGSAPLGVLASNKIKSAAPA